MLNFTSRTCACILSRDRLKEERETERRESEDKSTYLKLVEGPFSILVSPNALGTTLRSTGSKLHLNPEGEAESRKATSSISLMKEIHDVEGLVLKPLTAGSAGISSACMLHTAYR